MIEEMIDVTTEEMTGDMTAVTIGEMTVEVTGGREYSTVPQQVREMIGATWRAPGT
jgi:hypothetical protein